MVASTKKILIASICSGPIGVILIRISNRRKSLSMRSWELLVWTQLKKFKRMEYSVLPQMKKL